MLSRFSGAALLRPGFSRLLLAWLVVFHHFCWLALGTWGVFVFFTLSGYWISRMWETKYRSLRYPYFAFIGSRYWRLWPLYLFCLGLCAAVLMKVSIRGPEVRAEVTNFWWMLRALAIVSSSSQDVFLVPVWTLDVEMQFYLAAPWLWWLFRKVTSPGNGKVGLIGLGLVGAASLGANWETAGPFLHRYLVFFLAGMAIHRWAWKPSGQAVVGALGALVLVVGVVLANPHWRPIMGVEVMSAHDAHLHLLNTRLSGVLALLSLPWIAYSVQQAGSRVDRELGNLAYSVYLFHYIVFLALDSSQRLKAFPAAAVSALGMVAIAVGSVVLYCLVEIPGERLRRGLIRSTGARRAP